MMNRDIYKREERFRYWLGKTKEDKINGNDILRFITYMQEQNLSLMWMTRTITILLHVSRMLGKPFKDATKDDIKKVIAWMQNNYSVSSIRKYKQVIKYFYKVIYGNNEYYPIQVAWITGKVSKDIKRKEEELSFNNYLTEDEVKRLIDTATSIQRKAFIAVGYETGARPEELLSIRLKDIHVDSLGCKVILRGKTVERITRVVIYMSLLRQWLDIHPFKNDPNAYLWLSEATNHKFEPLGLRGREVI